MVFSLTVDKEKQIKPYKTYYKSLFQKRKSLKKKKMINILIFGKKASNRVREQNCSSPLRVQQVLLVLDFLINISPIKTNLYQYGLYIS